MKELQPNLELSYEGLKKEYNTQIARYNALIDTSPDGIFIFTPIKDEKDNVVDFNITYYNEVGAIMGHFPPNAQFESLLTILPHLKDSPQFEMHRQVLLTGQPIQFETSFRNEEGKEYGWFIVSLMKLEDAVLSRFIDITDKKINEERFANQAAFYNGILEASINGVIACEAIKDFCGKVIDFNIIKVNKAFTEMTGKTVAQTEGKSLLNVFHSNLSKETFEMYVEVLATGKPIRKEIRGATKLENWYDVSVSKIGTNTIAVTFTDITERMNVFAEIDHQRNLLNNILQHSPSGIAVSEVIRDESGEVADAKFVMVNELAEKFLGSSKGTMLKKTMKEIDPHVDESGILQMAALTLLTGESFRTQYLYEQSKMWVELGVSKMDENRLINIFTNITTTKEFQMKLENTVDKLRQINASLEEFTYAASHDLKEPIRKIRIFAERLKMMHFDSISKEGHELLDKLMTSGLRMSLLVDDLLNYSQVSFVKSQEEIIDLNVLLNSVYDDLELEIEEKQATITNQDLPKIKGQRRQLQQMFQNLLSNSLRYSRTGVQPIISISNREVNGIDIELDITTEEKERKFYEIKISDNGIGFDPKNVHKIFRVFQRLHNRNEYDGTGIGLSIVKRVVENHNGYITALGNPDKGAVFTIYLPV